MRTTSTLLAAALTLGAAAPAQTLYSINGSAGAFASIVEQTGPPTGICLWPNGPYLGGFLTNAPFPCSTAAAFPAPPALGGDIAVARDLDLIYVTDGTNITLYSTGGSPLRSFTLASVMPPFGTITGLGYNAVAGVLWVCNATTAVGITPPGPANCPGLVVVAVPPFALPAVGSSYTDIDWDPVSNSLYACTTAGLIVNVLPGGLLGGYGITAPPLTCATGGLYGLAMDHSYFGGPAAMYVTNGAMIERITPIAGPPASTFYATSACFPATSPPISGLSFSAHGIAFGAASPPAYPILTSSGQSISPNLVNFSLNMSATPGSFAIIFIGLGGSQCPAIPFGPTAVYINTPAVFIQGPVGGSGFVSFPIPIPALMPLPATFFLQGVEVFGASFSGTNGLAVSMTRP